MSSASNTGFPSNPFSSSMIENSTPIEVASAQPQGSTTQGTGLGMLVLPKGETVTILPSAPSTPQVVTPASEEQVAQVFSPNSVRVIPPAGANQARQNSQTQEGLSFDGAVISEIKALRSEWRQNPQKQEEDDSGKKKKFKNRRTKKNDPLKLRTKAKSRFDKEREKEKKEQEQEQEQKEEVLKKKKAKKSSLKSLFGKAKK